MNSRTSGAGHCAQKRGFTLIELLVVIAIIAILAAILFPVFARARERARATACLSNCKQLGLAIEMYKQDFDGFFPFSVNPNASPNNWYGYLGPYIKNTQIQLCPDDPETWNAPGVLGYSYNQAFGYTPNASKSGMVQAYCGINQRIYDGINESVVRSPATSIVMTEASLMYGECRWGNFTGTPQTEAYCLANVGFTTFYPYSTTAEMTEAYSHPGAYQPDSGIHFGGCNNVFADGHAKWQELDALMNYTNWCP